MIDCTYKDFVVIRHLARVIQDVASLKLLQKYNKDPIQRHLILTILHASWIDHSKHADYGWKCGQTKHLERCFPQIYH
jgi:hypothetical protein